MSETSAEIFAESSKYPVLVNPGHEPPSTTPSDTTRSPAAIELDIMATDDIILRYDAAILAETGKPAPPLDAGPYWALRYKRSHFCMEHYYALQKGNS